MKTVKIEVENLVYEFYNKVARQAGVPVEEIMSNALFRMAGELALSLGKGEMRREPEEKKGSDMRASASARKKEQNEQNESKPP